MTFVARVQNVSATHSAQRIARAIGTLAYPKWQPFGGAAQARPRGVDGGPFRVQRVREMSTAQYAQYALLFIAFIVASLFFWSWWLQFDNVGNWFLFGVRTWVMFYIGTCLPFFYLVFLGQMKRPVPVKAPAGARVALMTLTVPGSESLEIVERQLIAMTAVEYPHDSWILVDKLHSPEILALATTYGVKYFSRHDVETWGREQVERWNQPKPPFQAKTKAGNVNACLEAWRLLGMDYEYFVQYDIDHNPIPAYLDNVLGFFRDATVAWVQSPSVIKNHAASWTAWGALEQEYILQGVLQRGFYGLTDTPMIIGSHCAYRLSAIEQIGGFQPTRAEDHLDTLYLAADGWKGVYLPEIIASGDGPEDFRTYTEQQFAWAFSMFQVLQGHTGRMFGKLSFLQTIVFLFAQTWYVLWSTAMLAMFLLPIVGLLFNTPTSHASFSEFIVHYLPQALVATAAWWWSRQWFLPRGLPALSWRGVVLHIARWPSVLSAIIQAALRVQKPYMITVKGMGAGQTRFDTLSHLPYFLLVIAGLGAVQGFLLRVGRGAAQGDLLYTLIGVLMVLLVFVVVLFKDVKELAAQLGFLKSITLRLQPLLILFVLLGSMTATLYSALAPIQEAVVSGAHFNVSYLQQLAAPIALLVGGVPN